MLKPKFAFAMFGAAFALAMPMGCGDDDTTDGGGDGGSAGDAGGDGGSSGSGGGGGDGGPPPGCPALDERTDIEVSGEISEDTTWTCENRYFLTEKIYIVGGATLTVEAGTQVEGDMGSALIASTTGRLVTEGTAAAPVVFTSSAGEGSRASKDWGGIVLLGTHPINVAAGTDTIEGLDPGETRGTFGGDNEAHDCGSLKYTRIEFGGFPIAADNELNGLSVGACGTATEISYVQVHRGADDGIEYFGGAPKTDHVVLTSIEDDSIDWDFGFTGTIQFAVIEHSATAGDAGWETDSNPDDNDAMPRSNPTVFNVTVIGGAASGSPGWVARRGTWGTVGNAIFAGFPAGAIDVRDAATVAGTATDPPSLVITNSIFFGNGDANFPAETSTDDTMPDFDDDEGFDEATYFMTAEFNNQEVDPVLTGGGGWIPEADGPTADGATPPSGLDTSATYIGAFEPGGADWTEGWTAYPEN